MTLPISVEYFDDEEMSVQVAHDLFWLTPEEAEELIDKLQLGIQTMANRNVAQTQSENKEK